VSSDTKPQKIPKERIDKILIDRGLVSTRARAQAMILAGHVLVDETPVTKAGEKIALDRTIRLREPELKYVSRGALKLKGALEHFGLTAENKIGLDVGSSTGGFTEVLLETGAKKVYAIDVGTNQLAWKIRNDPRVISRENCNARYLEPADFEPKPSIFVMDVSFISIKLILPSVAKLLEPNSTCIVLFKPQFELGREWIGEGGIVKDQVRAKLVLSETLEWAKEYHFCDAQVIDSPIQGTDGNHEYLIYWVKR
jgi:23S rRNA (cytidine1920-2'-O)/16S rRNA (cytidine1409-2'-O)-methyltransferase